MTEENLYLERKLRNSLNSETENEKSSRDLWNNNRNSNICHQWSLKGRGEREAGGRSIETNPKFKQI